MLLGCVLTLLAGVGVVRFGDVFARMHALTKASTVGLVLVLGGAAIVLDDAEDVTSLIVAALLQVLTMPVGANLIARSTYRASGIPLHLDDVDELADHEDDVTRPDPDPGPGPGPGPQPA